MFEFSRYHRAFSLIAIFSTLFPTLSDASSPQLTAAECQLIRDYDADSSTPSFIDEFIHMVHTREYCSEIGKSCEGPIERRTREFSIWMLPTSEKRKHYVGFLAMAQMADFADVTMNVNAKGSPDPLPFSDGINVLVFHKHTRDGLIAKRHPSAKKLLKKFTSNDVIQCVGVNFNWSESPFEYSEVWVKESISDKAFGECIREEIYNTLGVPGDPIGDASVYSNEKYQSKDHGFPVFRQISLRERTVMKLLYSNRVKNGMNKSQSRKAVETEIEKHCF